MVVFTQFFVLTHGCIYPFVDGGFDEERIADSLSAGPPGGSGHADSRSLPDLLPATLPETHVRYGRRQH